MTVFIDAHIRREIKEIHFFLFFLQKLSIFHLKELFHIFLCFFFFFSQKLEKENLNLNINLITIDHQFTFILLQFFQNSVLEYLITQYPRGKLLFFNFSHLRNILSPILLFPEKRNPKITRVSSPKF